MILNLGGFNSGNELSQSSGDLRSERSKFQQGSGSSDSDLPGLQKSPSSLCSHMAEKESALVSCLFFYEDTSYTRSGLCPCKLILPH